MLCALCRALCTFAVFRVDLKEIRDKKTLPRDVYECIRGRKLDRVRECWERYGGRLYRVRRVRRRTKGWWSGVTGQTAGSTPRPITVLVDQKTRVLNLHIIVASQEVVALNLGYGDGMDQGGHFVYHCIPDR